MNNYFTPSSVAVKATLLLTSTLTVMSGTAISPALPELCEHFSDIDRVEFWAKLVVTIHNLFLALGAPIVGQINDRYGHKPLLIISTVAYSLTGSAGFLLDSLWAILILRAFFGLAVAGVMVSVTSFIAMCYCSEARVKILSWQSAAMSSSGVAYLFFGGWLADINWRIPFLIYLFPLALVPFICLLQEPISRDSMFDLSSKKRQTHRVKSSRLPLKLLASIYAIALIYRIIYGTIFVQLPFYLKDLFDSKGIERGLSLGALASAQAIAAYSYFLIKTRLNFATILAAALVVAGIGYSSIGGARIYILVLMALIASGLGFGLFMPNFKTWLSSDVPPTYCGRALGGLATSCFLGQFLAAVISQPVVSSIGLSGTFISFGSILLLLGTLIYSRERFASSKGRSKSLHCL